MSMDTITMIVVVWVAVGVVYGLARTHEERAKRHERRQEELTAARRRARVRVENEER
jgi:hypothetical protein